MRASAALAASAAAPHPPTAAAAAPGPEARRTSGAPPPRRCAPSAGHGRCSGDTSRGGLNQVPSDTSNPTRWMVWSNPWSNPLANTVVHPKEDSDVAILSFKG